MLPVVTVARDRCRRCYSCVRGCPAKAIRVQEGHAEVIAERCVSCGRCVRICTQSVKKIVDNLPAVRSVLAGSDPVVMLAPSFAAAFLDARPGQIVAALRRCGFAAVYEVAFGADLVSEAYAKLYNEDPVRMLITTPCPAAVFYIEKFAVELLPFLSPILSPMAAMGKALKQRLRPGCSVVFAGPCTAKIKELQEPEVQPWVDAVMTFDEVEQIIRDHQIDVTELNDEEFDFPVSYLGGIYPMGGGLIRSAGLPSDLFQNSVHHVAGRADFTDLVMRLNQRMSENRMSELQTRFFDVLFCQGCIDGPVMPEVEGRLRRKERIVEYLRSRRPVSRQAWESAVKSLSDLDLRRGFRPNPQLTPTPSEEQIRHILARTNKLTPEQELNCGACGYKSCRQKAIAVINGVAEVEMCLPYMIDKLEATVSSLHYSYERLSEAQTQLIRSERLASMGQMAAGIAHEVNNPLGTILIYSHLMRDYPGLDEGMRSDVEMIIEEANRCKTIVGGLLNFARQTKAVFAPVPLREILERAAETSRAQALDLAVEITVRADPDLPPACVDSDQMLQVLLNLLKNAADAMPSGGNITISADYHADSGEFVISVRDQGTGIQPAIMDRIFSPFFSTKAVGKGTGLGLAICYGIVKIHRGQIRVYNNPDGPGATFEIVLPASVPMEEVVA
jgi:two-component system, NtrC family, sensor kinase